MEKLKNINFRLLEGEILGIAGLTGSGKDELIQSLVGRWPIDSGKFYLKNKHNVNNWDLVDLSAPYILGDYLIDKNTNILYDLAESKHLWDRRIAIVSTAAFIKEQRFKETIELSKMLLNDKHDLIHKAAGWMLREVGKKDESTLIKFLDEHTKQMPRTMLRYSLEKLSDKKRDYYMRL